ncbi:hypothetical protein EES42_07780 [Streptomyces sp. ADI95-17]|nr:hypothetical protein EES42_07780 [Streptomyces sp. ADI95-17]
MPGRAVGPGLPVSILRTLHDVLPVLMCAEEPGERLKKWRAPAGPYRDA